MHLLFMPPVGWGFMLVHRLGNGVTVVTDGGSLSPCFGETVRTMGNHLTHIISSNGLWAWILSHPDYDHYSITAALVNQNAWSKPRAVVLPGAYSESVCREAYRDYLKLTYIVAELLKVPRPSILDLSKIVKEAVWSGKVFGVFQGARLKARGLVYHVIWPLRSEAIRMCKKLIVELNEKIERAQKKCRERGAKCDEALGNADEDAGRLWEILELIHVTDQLDLERELTKDFEGEANLRKALWTRLELQRFEGAHPESYNEIYARANAVSELRELRLLALYRSVVNMFSLAYAIELEDSLSHIAEVWIKDFQASSYGGPVEDYVISVLYLRSPLLLYPADLDGNELNQAIHYYRKCTQSVAVEVAAHHGNAYAPELQNIIPRIVFIPRCHQHPSREIRGGFKYGWRLWGLPIYMRVLAEHSYGIEVRV